MRQVMVRYTVKPEAAAENEALARRVYEELHQANPTGIRYATFVLEDGVSFVHVASSDDERSPLQDVAAFQAFTEGINARVEEPPVTTRLREVGSYGLWAK
jgi:hypothetical protein